MTRGAQSPLQEGQELIGILDPDDDLFEEDADQDGDEDDHDDAVATRDDEAPVAPWDQLIAAVDREFFPLEAAARWGTSRFRAK